MGGESGSTDLLHLVSLGVIITVGYIGLDRVRREPDPFWDELKEAEKKAEELLQSRLDITRGEGPITLQKMADSRLVHLVYILCFLANIPIKLNIFQRCAHIIRRQRRLPLLGYYRSRTDRRIVRLFAIIEIITFLILSANTGFR